MPPKPTRSECSRHIFDCDRNEPVFAYSFESDGYAVPEAGQPDDAEPRRAGGSREGPWERGLA
jgi:hypothetical protein